MCACKSIYTYICIYNVENATEKKMKLNEVEKFQIKYTVSSSICLLYILENLEWWKICTIFQGGQKLVL